MSQEATLEKVPTLEEVERLFTAWRQANQRPRRIPEDLWEVCGTPLPEPSGQSSLPHIGIGLS